MAKGEARDGGEQHAHAAHRRFRGSATLAVHGAAQTDAPSGSLSADNPEVQAKLESLDDLVFEAINGKDEALAETFKTLHQFAAYGLAALVVAHVGGALKHQFVDRDGLLARMWPGRA